MKLVVWWCGLVVSLLAAPAYTNALIHESSPYLQQHAHNPVDWYPWGKKAFIKAKREHKLIFLSIGYSTCHWCHEMERESFTDEAVAKLLNDNFVSIKVDREEYPQIDKKYQALYLAKYGKRGGWPLSVFLTPEGKVLYIATYIPKEAGYGSPGLLKLLPELATLRDDPEALRKRIASFGVPSSTHRTSSATIDIPVRAVIEKSIKRLEETYDKKHGGFGKRPKFPEASKIEMLLTIVRLTGNTHAMQMLMQTLTKMARSGLYDQVEGGFFRYTTDAGWEYPHYEKMLYINAELITVYARAYRVTADPLYRRVVEETIAHMRDHFSREGLFFAASDADSDGEEGGYYIYDYTRIMEALRKEGWDERTIKDNLVYYGIEEDGNVDGELSLPHLGAGAPPPKAEAFRDYLATLRRTRTFPFVDHKILTSWNAMMIKALFVAGGIDPRYNTEAEHSLEALLHGLYLDGKLYHQRIGGARPVRPALLEDYAFLVDALIEGYERTYKARYLTLAQTLAKEAVRRFYRKGVWYLSDDGIEAVADADDRYYTSPLSVMLDDLLRLAVLLEERDLSGIVKRTLYHWDALLEKDPTSAPRLAILYLRYRLGDVVIHASKDALFGVQSQIERAKYPFLLSKAQENAGYLACGINVCFAADRNITKLLKRIQKMKRVVPSKGATAWQK